MKVTGMHTAMLVYRFTLVRLYRLVGTAGTAHLRGITGKTRVMKSVTTKYTCLHDTLLHAQTRQARLHLCLAWQNVPHGRMRTLRIGNAVAQGQHAAAFGPHRLSRLHMGLQICLQPHIGCQLVCMQLWVAPR